MRDRLTIAASVCGAAASLYYGLRHFGVFDVFRRYLTTSVEVTSGDDAYHWVKLWLDGLATDCLHFSAEVRAVDEQFFEDARRLQFVPAVGRHVVQYMGSRILVSRSRATHVQDLSTGLAYESISLTVLGRRAGFLREVLRRLRAAALAADDGKTVVYLARGGMWDRSGAARLARPLASVVLPGGVAEALVADVRRFLASREWYLDRGIPWRRGYLLHGPPGCGKTSLIRALCGTLRLGISVVPLADAALGDEQLASLFSTAKGGAAILLEDVDAAAATLARAGVAGDDPPTPRGGAGAARGGVSLAGLLNALDGAAAQEGRVVFMTTNRRAALDPAVARKGRVDVDAHIGYATAAQAAEFVSQFFRDTPPGLAEAAAPVEGAGVAMADIQGLCIENSLDPSRVLVGLPALAAAARVRNEAAAARGVVVDLTPTALDGVLRQPVEDAARRRQG